METMVLGKAGNFRCTRTDREREVRALETTDIDARSFSSTKANLGTCVDYCSGPNFTGVCTRNHCTDYGQCTNVREDGGMESIGFEGDTSCAVYINHDCKQLGRNSVTVVKKEVRNMKAFAHWDRKASSFKCGRHF